MNVGWYYRREHLRINSRSHYVVKVGGDQPNVVPTTASVWYYFRETTAPLIRFMWATGDSVARGAAMMSGTKLTGTRLLGQAWPRHFNRPIAEDMYGNIRMVGLPTWTDADQTFAKAVQKEMGSEEPRGLATELDSIDGPVAFNRNYGGGSDDIGDVSWNVPTVTLRYPSNIPGLPGHHWSSSMASATPIAHKGATAGAKVMAATLLDIIAKPALTDSAWSYFTIVQTKDQKYEPFNRPGDQPAIELNSDILGEYREKMRPYYYDPSKGTYMEQLGVSYPTVRQADGSCPVPNAVP
jgi:aminobenzoyl-glutamate utilization protein B